MTNTLCRSSVLFLHGFMGSSQEWQPFIEMLPQHRSYAIDLPGHGAYLSNQVYDYTFDGIHTYLGQQIHLHFSDQKPWLVGYSMGGRVALSFACSRPEAVGGLILISAHPGLSNKNDRQKRLESDQDLAQELVQLPLLSQSFLNRWFSAAIYATLSAKPDLLRRIQASKTLASPTYLSLALQGYGLAQQDNLWPLIPKLPFPIIYISGKEDQKFADIGNRLQALQNTISHYCFDGCSHAVHLEAPDRVLEILRRLGEGVVTKNKLE